MKNLIQFLDTSLLQMLFNQNKLSHLHFIAYIVWLIMVWVLSFDEYTVFIP